MIELPDISHLTHDEQQKIREVLQRQQEEEEKEKNMLRMLHDQFQDYKSCIKLNQDQAKPNMPNDEDPVCQLCLKTKFADGCGHLCAFCKTKFCSRCGGKMVAKTNKVIWVCNNCRKCKEITYPLNLGRQGSRCTQSPTPVKELDKLEGDDLRTGVESATDINHCAATEQSYKERPEKREKTPQMPRGASLNDRTRSDHSQMLTKETSSQQAESQIYDDHRAHSGLRGSRSCYTQGSVPHGQVSKFDGHPQVSAFSESSTTSVINDKPPAAVATRTVTQADRTLNDQDNDVEDLGEVSRNLPNCRPGSTDVCRQASNFNGPYSTAPSNRNLHGCQSEPNISGRWGKADVTSDMYSHKKYSLQQRFNKSGLFMRDVSVSSSEEDARSTTEYSSFDDVDKETSISDNEYIRSRMKHHLPHRMFSSSYSQIDQYMDSMTKSSNSLCSCQQSMSNNRDSGVESGSVLCADGAQQEQFPVSWNPSPDGRFLIGHLVLYKNVSSTSLSCQTGALLGLKVVGGKCTPSGKLGAFVTRVKKGSLAETIGHLKPGDEILSWNNYPLEDATFDQVYEIIFESKEDPMVELVVSRPITYEPRIPETRTRQTVESSSCSLDSERRDFEENNGRPLQGKIQMRIWYDGRTQQLYVTAMRAMDLPLRDGGLPRNPYLKMLLLPGGSNTYKRRTKTAKKTLAPEWMQTFVYGDVRKDDLGAMALELTLWDYDRSLEANNKFMGEVMIDLGLVCLDDEPHWFRLMPLGYGMNQEYVLENAPNSAVKHASLSSENDVDPQCCNRNSAMVISKNQDQRTLARVPYSQSTLPKRQLPSIPISKTEGVSAAKEKRTSAEDLSLSRGAVFEEASSVKTSPVSDTLSVERTFQTFVGGVGPGQVIGRQTLALNSMGEIELGLYERRSQLEVKVVRARNLACKRGAKVRPAHYVKVYMMLGQECTAKKKTKLAARSFNPTFEQTLVFDSGQAGNGLQVIVWGDYGRMDNKVFVGMAQINLDETDLSSYVIAWYKLFPTPSVMDTSAYGLRKESYSSFGSSCQTLS